MVFVIVPSLIIYVREGTIHTNSLFISFGLQIVFRFQKLERGVTCIMKFSYLARNGQIQQTEYYGMIAAT